VRLRTAYHRKVRLVPGVVVDRLPRRLWRVGNRYGNGIVGYHLHCCYGGQDARRTVEWHGKEIGRGRANQGAEMESHNWEPE
jgi:hypothetical protein